MCTQGKAQERPENTVSLHLRLMVAQRQPTSIKKTNQKKNKQKTHKKTNKTANTGERRVWFPVFNKKCLKAYNEIRRLCPIQREKNSVKTAPEKDLMVDILHKQFKTIVLKILKELKEDVEKNQEKTVWTKEILVKR